MVFKCKDEGKEMTSLEGWGAFMLLILLVWSTDIIDWVCDEVEKRFKK